MSIKRRRRTEQNPTPDEDILAELHSRIWSQDTIRSLDLYDVKVEIESGEARLSGHVVVSARFELDDQIVAGEYVIPAWLIDVCNGCNITLSETKRKIAGRQEFDANEFPLAPPSWRPPFPFVAGSVLWSNDLQSIPSWLSTIGVPMPADLLDQRA